MKTRSAKWFIPAVVCVALFIGGALGYLGNSLLNPDSGNSGCTSKYAYINPDPECDVFDQRASKLDTLQEALTNQVEQLELKPGIDRVAVFTRDLVTRRFAGVNDDQVFYLASLLKVPVLIAYFKYAEIEPAILDDSIIYDGSVNEYDLQDTAIPDHLQRGKAYTVENLLYRSVAYSDNTAIQILIKRLPPEFIDKIFSAIGIQFKKPQGEKEDLINARSYSNVFRILYNSSYLSREYSNKALELLTHTSFTAGAVAGLPNGTVIAHKFGERTNIDSSGAVVSRQLHDCGIVYAKNGEHPYIFCIMTEGSDFGSLQKAISEVSTTIYSILEK